jgi:hypothetical protein
MSYYKLTHGMNFFICNELFAIEKSIVSLMLHEFMVALNDIFKNFNY